MTQQPAATRPLAPLASSPFTRFPLLPYDRNRGTTIATLPAQPLDLEGGGHLDLEAGGYLELEGGTVGSIVQFRDGTVSFS